jgi:hypothetical protein
MKGRLLLLDLLHNFYRFLTIYTWVMKNLSTYLCFLDCFHMLCNWGMLKSILISSCLKVLHMKRSSLSTACITVYFKRGSLKLLQHNKFLFIINSYHRTSSFLTEAAFVVFITCMMSRVLEINHSSNFLQQTLQEWAHQLRCLI